VFAVDYSPDEQKLAIAGGDASIRILDIVGHASSADEQRHD
jgi:hypothetical protein